jgi:hypothetical protein
MSWFDRFKKSPPRPSPLTRGRALNCVPRKNTLVREERRSDGLIRLIYPMSSRPLITAMARKLGRSPTTTFKKLDLDEMGTFVWEQIDGVRPVRGLVLEFVSRYGVHSREAEVAMSSFLRDLGRRGLIGLEDPGQGTDI